MDEASKEKAREKVRDNKELQYFGMNRKYLEFCNITIPSSPTNEGKKLRCAPSYYIAIFF